PPLRDAGPLLPARRAGAHRLLVPDLPKRRGSGGRVREGMAVRARHLHDTLRCFCLGAFSVLEGDVARGAEIPFAFEEHGGLGRPALYEYRPLVHAFVEARSAQLAQREDARAAVDELLREPAAAIFARAAAAGELAAHWPEANGLLPKDFGRERDRLGVIELERSLPAGQTEPPDAPGELADAVSALRLATSGAIAAGPVLFERLDWRPYGIRPVLPIAATAPAGEPTRLDPVRGALARMLLGRLGLADGDPELGEALDRWELSLFQAEPVRSEQLRGAL